MKVSEVKENLGKSVYYEIPMSRKLTEYLLNGCIIRLDPKDPKRRVFQLELKDKNANCVMIVPIDSVKLKNSRGEL